VSGEIAAGRAKANEKRGERGGDGGRCDCLTPKCGRAKSRSPLGLRFKLRQRGRLLKSLESFSFDQSNHQED